MKINQISPQEAKFTEVLDTIALKPKILYYRGKIPEKRLKSVAIVGARIHTSYDKEIAYRAAYDLASAGIVIVSGLAYGIDSIAHRGALDAGGLTIAVLGTPIDHIYPSAHLALAEEILSSGGAIISEYAPSHLHAPSSQPSPKSSSQPSPKSSSQPSPKPTPQPSSELSSQPSPVVPSATSSTTSPSASPVTSASPSADLFGLPPLAPGEYETANGTRKVQHKTSFLYRNRLISGLSDAILITEAASHSGSLNTASHALDQGKDVFAVPGDITRPLSAGCNHLIASGALLYTSPEDILARLFPSRPTRTKKPPFFPGSPLEHNIIDLIFQGERDDDAIIEKLHITPQEFNQAITMLELKNLVHPLGLNRWALK